jgi:hypothetical protein
VLTEGEIMERMNKIQLRPNLHPEEIKQYEDLFHNLFIHLFVFSYNDLRKITMEQQKN